MMPTMNQRDQDDHHRDHSRRNQTMTTKAGGPTQGYAMQQRGAKQRLPKPPQEPSQWEIPSYVWVVLPVVIPVVLWCLVAPVFAAWFLVLVLFAAIVLIGAILTQRIKGAYHLLILATIVTTMFACACIVGLLRLAHYL